jgi:hypothetical protein
MALVTAGRKRRDKGHQQLDSGIDLCRLLKRSDDSLGTARDRGGRRGTWGSALDWRVGCTSDRLAMAVAAYHAERERAALDALVNCVLLLAKRSRFKSAV